MFMMRRSAKNAAVSLFSPLLTIYTFVLYIHLGLHASVIRVQDKEITKGGEAKKLRHFCRLKNV